MEEPPKGHLRERIKQQEKLKGDEYLGWPKKKEITGHHKHRLKQLNEVNDFTEKLKEDEFEQAEGTDHGKHMKEICG